ncbi:hypothetical protein NQ318_008471 [Aromia moschata]|uniref:Uncharacterized protein n=1 Tax=Aromia moschata TaxID=1265417 RepID=A0AAV8Y958_9CUCU|nr:hypothetical protein NQ318_008471 [Aromia moschata]
MEDCPENDLESTMRQFWQVEEVPMISTSPDDELCEKLYVEGRGGGHGGMYSPDFALGQM